MRRISPNQRFFGTNVRGEKKGVVLVVFALLSILFAWLAFAQFGIAWEAWRWGFYARAIRGAFIALFPLIFAAGTAVGPIASLSYGCDMPSVDEAMAQQGARANASVCHAVCYRMSFEMKQSNLESNAAHGAPAAGVAHL